MAETKPTEYQLTILSALQGKQMYQGTVSSAIKAARRVKGKTARIARRQNRG
jgi:hypothetical protein